MSTGTELAQHEDTSMELVARDSPSMDGQSRGMIDIQIATARRFPRQLARFRSSATQLATYNPDIAGQCTYAKPIGGGKFAIGPSIRLAEIVSQTWGNMRATSRIVEESERYLVAQGECIDLETNFAVSVNVRRGITYKGGARYSDSMIDQTANAAMAIAFRNAIFKVVPKTMVETIRLEAVKVANGGETFEERRTKWLGYWSAKGVEGKRLYSALGIAGFDDLTNDHMETLRALATALKDREVTIEEAFPPLALLSSVATDPEPVSKEKKPSKSDALASTIKATPANLPVTAPSDDAFGPGRQ